MAGRWRAIGHDKGYDVARVTWGQLSTRQRTAVVVAGVVQLSLQAAALHDLHKRPGTEVRGPKAAWLAACFVNTLGPLAYFAVGVKRR